MSDSRIHEAEETEVQEPRKRGLFRRGEDGLTTLEWLLIVAAVAGLAALAVVLVTNVVDQTAEQIGGSSARKTAAQVAASQITQNAHDDPPALTSDSTAFGLPTAQLAANTSAWNNKVGEAQKACNRLLITYGDVSPKLAVSWVTFDLPLVANNAAAVLSLWQDGLDDATKGCTIS